MTRYRAYKHIARVIQTQYKACKHNTRNIITSQDIQTHQSTRIWHTNITQGKHYNTWPLQQDKAYIHNTMHKHTTQHIKQHKAYTLNTRHKTNLFSKIYLQTRSVFTARKKNCHISIQVSVAMTFMSSFLFKELASYLNIKYYRHWICGHFFHVISHLLCGQAANNVYLHEFYDSLVFSVIVNHICLSFEYQVSLHNMLQKLPFFFQSSDHFFCT